MPDPAATNDTVTTLTGASQTQTVQQINQPASVLGKSDQPQVAPEQTVLAVAGEAEKAAQDAENKRLIDADPTTLNDEDKAKRDGLVKAQEDEKAKALAAEKAKGVPEKYDFKLPDGYTLEQARFDKVTPIFKDLGLTNEQAQKLVDLDIALKKEDTDAAAASFKKFLDDSAKETMDALGRNAKAELAYVARVKAHFSPETIEVLNSSGMGNIKSFIFDLAKLGRKLSEEKLVDTGKGSAGGKDPASVLFPNMK